jgi:ABC-type polysaccharide/polyol phosphate export permease
MKIGDINGIVETSRAFDQTQVFVQMLGGYFIKNFIKNVEKEISGSIKKKKKVRAYDQIQAFVHMLGGYSYQKYCSYF